MTFVINKMVSSSKTPSVKPDSLCYCCW